MVLSDTICAISTPPGRGAIAVIRVSGSLSFDILNKIFTPSSSSSTGSMIALPYKTAHLGNLNDGSRTIDQVLVTLFKAPASYTGDDVVEIACHGSTVIQQQILGLLISNGARLANPGEFTQRAFLNGKMSLDQAEAVADLIASRNEASRRIALQQTRGGFSSELAKLRDRLLWFISLIELELDFSDEDVEFANRVELINLVCEIESHLDKLAGSFALGNAVKNGVPVVIAGHTNAGKSTLLNALLNEDRAIVSEIHGTTRDAIEDTINLGGITFRFIDTAGLRGTTDEIEELGINITYRKIKEASVVLLMVDASDPDEKLVAAVSDVKRRINPASQKLVIVVNKNDLVTDPIISRMFSRHPLSTLASDIEVVAISAKKRLNLDTLTGILLKSQDLGRIESGDTVITNARHFEALTISLAAIRRVKISLEANLPNDLLAQDVREALSHLGSITGQFTTDEILGNIFSNFCIGK